MTKSLAKKTPQVLFDWIHSYKYETLAKPSGIPTAHGTAKMMKIQKLPILAQKRVFSIVLTKVDDSNQFSSQNQRSTRVALLEISTIFLNKSKNDGSIKGKLPQEFPSSTWYTFQLTLQMPSPTGLNVHNVLSCS